MVEITPHADQTMRESPAEPVSLTTPDGETKMPEPMMVPMIIPTPLKRVMLRLSSIFSPLAGATSVGLSAGGAGTREVDGEAGRSSMRPAGSGSASAAGGEEEQWKEEKSAKCETFPAVWEFFCPLEFESSNYLWIFGMHIETGKEPVKNWFLKNVTYP